MNISSFTCSHRAPVNIIFALIISLFISTSSLAIAESSIEQSKQEQFISAVAELKTNSFKKKAKIVEKIVELDVSKSTIVLEALLKNELYLVKTTKQIVIMKSQQEAYVTYDIWTQKQLEVVEKNTLKKVRTNNKLRKKIRNLIALTKLKSPDESVRLDAINEMLKAIQPSHKVLLEQALSQEKSEVVAEQIQLAINLLLFKTTEAEEKVKVIQKLSQSLHPKVKQILLPLVEKDANGEYLQKDKAIIEAAEKALKSIGRKESLFNKVETVFFGLSLGSVLLLSAIGLAITFGVMGVINMAHGELMMLGAYTTYLVQMLMPNNIDLSLIVAIPAAFIVSGLFGIAIERGVIRHLYGRPLETLLATFGISLLLQQLVRTAISAQNVAVETPSWLSGSWVINPIFSITYNRLYILFFALFLFALLLLLLKKTSLGLQVRAVAQNRTMAKAMGIKTQWIDSLTFGLGAGIAGIAGVALSQLTNVGPNLGQAYIIDSFMVVVFGGVESLWGTLVAAMTLGIANKFLEPWVGAVMAKIIVLVFLILFIQKKPKGLFPQKGRSTVGS